MHDYIGAQFDDLVDSYFQHSGVKGMEWYKNKVPRFQKQAAYAQYLPDPNTLNERIASQSNQDLKDATSRLKAENDFRRELNNAYDLQANYMKNRNADSGRLTKNLMNAVKWCMDTAPGKYARNAALYSGYEYCANKYGPDKAKVLFSGILKIK